MAALTQEAREGGREEDRGEGRREGETEEGREGKRGSDIPPKLCVVVKYVRPAEDGKGDPVTEKEMFSWIAADIAKRSQKFSFPPVQSKGGKGRREGREGRGTTKGRKENMIEVGKVVLEWRSRRES